jgi:hypothetical protein
VRALLGDERILLLDALEREISEDWYAAIPASDAG